MFQTIVFLHIAIFSYLNIVLKKRFFFVRYAECIHCNKQLLFHRDAVERGVFKPFPLPLPLSFPPWHQCQYKNNMPERRRERREGGAGKILFFSPPPPYERNEAGHPPPFSLSFSPPQPTAPKQSTHTLEGGKPNWQKSMGLMASYTTTTSFTTSLILGQTSRSPCWECCKMDIQTSRSF